MFLKRDRPVDITSTKLYVEKDFEVKIFFIFKVMKVKFDSQPFSCCSLPCLIFTIDLVYKNKIFINFNALGLEDKLFNEIFCDTSVFTF